MNPIKRKMASFLTEIARKAIETLDPQSPCAMELSGLDVDDVIRGEIEKICGAATLAEVTRILVLAARLKKSGGRDKEVIRGNLRRIVKNLVARVEKEQGELRLPRACRDLLVRP